MTHRAAHPSTAVLVAILTAGPLHGQEQSVLSLLDPGDRVLQVDGSGTDGALGPDDLVTGQGARVQAWRLRLEAGTPVQIDLRSADFDALLHLLGPGLGAGLRNDDGGDDLDSRICFTPEASGEFRVVAGSLNGSAGRYTLQAGPPVDGVCPPDAGGMDVDLGTDFEAGFQLELEEVAPDGPLPVPGEVRWTFSGDEPRVEGRPLRAWTVVGSAGDRLAFTHRAADQDTYLYLIGPGLPEPLRDDDGAGDLQARLCAELPAAGEFVVLAGPFSASSAGTEHTLDVRAGSEADALCTAYASSPERTVEQLLAYDTGDRVLTVDGEARGTLTGGQLHPASGDRVQAWRLEGEPGMRVTVDVVSESFDPTLRVVWPGLDEERYNDDAGDGCNSRLEIVIPEEGPVVLLPGAWSSGGSGDFLIRASTEPGPLESGGCGGLSEMGAATGAADAGWEMVGRLADPSDRLDPGTEVPVELTTDNSQVVASVRAIGFGLELTEAGDLVVEAVSEELDPVLYVMGPGLDEPLFDDDSAGALDARVEVADAQPGTYLIVVGALGGATGPVRVRTLRRPGD